MFKGRYIACPFCGFIFMNWELDSCGTGNRLRCPRCEACIRLHRLGKERLIITSRQGMADYWARKRWA